MNLSRLAGLAVICSIALAAFQKPASAGPSLVVDVASGKVLEQEDATRPWYPASLTKLLTVYIALSAVRDGRVSLDTPFVVSARAASMPPSKMGFRPGTEVTLDNVLKMMMVKSANDLAVVIAEGLDGSVENFADEMNRTAAKLGLRDSHFANPNGLPNPDHYSSARDLAIVARALFRDFPQYDWLYDIGAVKLGRMVIQTHVNIMGRYPGINGMKTGYTCAAGFNLVASVVRGGRHLIVVVLGSPNVKARTLKAGALMDAAFEGLFPDGPDLESLPKSSYTQPPDMHPLVCGRHRPRIALDEMPPIPPASDAAPGALPPEAGQMYAVSHPRFNPIPVFVGPKPGWTGAIAEANDSPPPLPISAYASLNSDVAPVARVQKATPLKVSRRRRLRRGAHPRAQFAKHAEGGVASTSSAGASQGTGAPSAAGHVAGAQRRHLRRAGRLVRRSSGAAAKAQQKAASEKPTASAKKADGPE